MLSSGIHTTKFFRNATAASASATSGNMSNNFDLAGALTFFLALIDRLLRLHQTEGAHLALCLFNIDVEDDGAITLRKEVDAPVAYISPEQTGRMNRQVDYRSDYYSLTCGSAGTFSSR